MVAQEGSITSTSRELRHIRCIMFVCRNLYRDGPNFAFYSKRFEDVVVYLVAKLTGEPKTRRLLLVTQSAMYIVSVIYFVGMQ